MTAAPDLPRETFAARTQDSSRGMRIVRRFLIVGAVAHIWIGAWSAYRTWVQVRSVDVRLVDATVRPGAPAFVHVVTSGRTPVDVRLELVQGDHHELLADLRVAASHDGFYDPRFRNASMTASFTTEFLADFHAGPAIVRVTGLGRPAWLHTPPPLVEETPVVLEP